LGVDVRRGGQARRSKARRRAVGSDPGRIRGRKRGGGSTVWAVRPETRGPLLHVIDDAEALGRRGVFLVELPQQISGLADGSVTRSREQHGRVSQISLPLATKSFIVNRYSIDGMNTASQVDSNTTSGFGSSPGMKTVAASTSRVARVPS
jgi:hypothetical protein